MRKQHRSSRWMAAALTALLGLGGLVGCAWIMGQDRPSAPNRNTAPSWEATSEPASEVEPAALTAYERRDPFSRRRSQRSHAAVSAASGEAGALLGYESGVAGELGGAIEAVGEERAEAPVAGGLPPVGAGSADNYGRSRRALWIAICLVVAIGLSAMWLSRKQTQA